MELKSRKKCPMLNSGSGQSEVTGAERRRVFGDLRVSRSFKAEKRKFNVGDAWFRVPPLSLCRSGVLSLLVSSALFFFSLSLLLSRNLSFISFFSFDRIRWGFSLFVFFTARDTNWT